MKNNNLNKILLKKGLSKANLADKTGLDAQYIGKVANGQIEPSISRGLLICRVLKVEPEEIWPLKNNDTRNFLLASAIVAVFLAVVIAVETKGIFWNADICHKGFDAWMKINETIYYIDFII